MEASQSGETASDPLSQRLQYGPSGRSAWMDIDWNRYQRTITIMGRNVSYVDVGKGPALIFIHGLSGNWQNWLENVPEFARDHRVIAVDLPGFGRSPLPRSGITIGLFCDVVIAVIRALDLGSATLIGHSMGGQIAAKLTIEHPELVERLVLVSPAGLTIDIARNPQILWVLKTFGWLYSAGARTARIGRDPLSNSGPLRKALLGVIAAYPERLPGALVQRQIAGAGTPGFAPSVLAIGNCDLRDELDRIVVPTLLIWGRSDRMIPHRDLYQWRRDVAQSEAITYEDTGHAPQFERPARFNTDVRAFLERNKKAIRARSKGVDKLVLVAPTHPAATAEEPDDIEPLDATLRGRRGTTPAHPVPAKGERRQSR